MYSPYVQKSNYLKLLPVPGHFISRIRYCLRFFVVGVYTFVPHRNMIPFVVPYFENCFFYLTIEAKLSNVKMVKHKQPYKKLQV